MYDTHSSARQRFADDAIAGLSQTPKVVPARYLYDATGSELFEEITRLPEYYPTRSEISVLERYGDAIAEAAGRGRVVVELGSGSSTKSPLLLRRAAPYAYVPIEISEAFLESSCAALQRKLPDLRILPVAGDFTRPVALPPEVRRIRKLGFFPGSTIGNLTPRAAVDLLRSVREMLGEDARLVIGFDLCRDMHRLAQAYDDAAGVTAAFNRNLLVRINRELNGSIPVGAFAHRSIWNEAQSRIEMHLVAQEHVTFEVRGRSFSCSRGESIHTENSYKYRPDEVAMLAWASGWQPVDVWRDDAEGFAVHLWSALAHTLEP